MAHALAHHNRDEWPTRLFKMRGFARVDVRYDAMRDRMFVYLERYLGGPPDSIDLPEGYRAMTLEAFRSWVDREVAKLVGASDFPQISMRRISQYDPTNAGLVVDEAELRKLAERPQYPGGIDDMGL